MQRIFNSSRRLTAPASARAFASSAQPNPFDKTVKSTLEHGGQKHNFYKLPALGDSRINQLPYSIRVLLESAVRNCDDFAVKENDVEKILDWVKTSEQDVEIPFRPARVILQDFT
jgi:aconitate hydratase